MALILIKKLDILCKCGCGQFVKQGNTYILGHQFMGKKHNEKAKRIMSDLKKGKKHTEEQNKLMSELMMGRVLTEEHKQKIGQANKGKKRTNEQNKKQSERNKGKKHTEEAKEKVKLSLLGNKRRLGIPHTEEAKEKISIKNKGKLVGENNHMYDKYGELNPNWNNGSSFEPYGSEFNKPLKQQILERDNYICQDPNCDGNHKKLHVHHIDYNKKNNNQKNLITLCSSCHMKTNSKNRRTFYTEFYNNLITERMV